MAGHLEVNKHVQYDLLGKLWEMLDIKNGEKESIKLINEMQTFKRHKIGDLTWQKLSDEYCEDDDEFVLSVYPWTFKFEGEEDCEGAVAEIHLSADLTVNKVYMVM